MSDNQHVYAFISAFSRHRPTGHFHIIFTSSIGALTRASTARGLSVDKRRLSALRAPTRESVWSTWIFGVGRPVDGISGAPRGSVVAVCLTRHESGNWVYFEVRTHPVPK